MPLASGMVRQRRQEILVERIAFAVDAHLLGHLRLEAPPLLGRIGQLAEGIGEFHPAGIELEALRHLRIVRGGAGEGGFGDRVLVEDRGAPKAKIGLDPLHDDAAEQVRPGVVRGSPKPCLRQAGGQVLPVGRAGRIDGGEKVDAGETLEGFGDAQAFRLQERVGLMAAKAPGSRLRPSQPRGRGSRCAVLHREPHRARRPGTIPAW